MHSSCRTLLGAAACFVALAAGAPASDHQIQVFQGPQGTTYGWDVARVGDLSGDQVDDIVITNTNASGTVEVYSGADGSLVWAINGTNAERIGSSIAPIGDVNNDGIPDLVAGGTGLSRLGSPPGVAVILSGADGSEIRRSTGNDPFEFFGSQVDGIGDVTGDQVDDYVVGAPGSFNGGAGAARVFSGADGSATGVEVIGNLDDRENLGYQVVGLGADVNGDQVPDFAVSAPGAEGKRSAINVGRVIIVSGADGDWIDVIKGRVQHQSFGTRMVAIGDVTGDGVTELAISSVVGPVSVTILDPRRGRAVNAYASIGDFVTGLAAMGDVDGDGIPDVAVGATHEVDGGLVRIFSGARRGKAIAVVRGDPGDFLGGSLAGIPDRNADGRPDLLAGLTSPNRADILATPDPVDPTELLKLGLTFQRTEARLDERAKGSASLQIRRGR